jgi:hypothetical protein
MIMLCRRAAAATTTANEHERCSGATSRSTANSYYKTALVYLKSDAIALKSKRNAQLQVQQLTATVAVAHKEEDLQWLFLAAGD